MWKAICLSLGLISLAVCVRFLLWPHSTREIELAPEAIDLGEVAEQQRLKTEFAIRNNAKVPYRVMNIVGTCRCTANEVVWPRTLQPGETLPVPVEYHTGRGDGAVKQRLVVLLEKTDERGTLSYAKPIDILSNVTPELRATPKTLDFGTVGPDDHTNTVSFRIQSIGGRTYNVESVEATVPQVEVEYPAIICPVGAEFQARLDCTGIYSSTYMNGVIEIALSGGRIDSFSVPFRALVSPAFIVTPDVLVFDAKSQVGAIQSLILRGCEPFRIAKIRTPVSVSVQSQPYEYAWSHELAVGLSEIRNGSLGKIDISLVGQSGRTGNVVVRVGRVHDGIESE